MPLPLRIFVRPPGYFLSQEINKYVDGVASSGVNIHTDFRKDLSTGWKLYIGDKHSSETS
jgi:hypothetical protein